MPNPSAENRHLIPLADTVECNFVSHTNLLWYDDLGNAGSLFPSPAGPTSYRW